ncbi:40S ribosomal S3 protein0 [Fusarium mundagurra]|uniref:40S ribosomal S3 protein0 n=1 Tax=Fusarium mundagurra TaxID=1567541 RepID=A0A8H5YBH9_9HYPO|nr:40S ribosomal S3 protein0 [Fusarium mundagurra]
MGKVHGSLARAGKVKSQTPKVEKQEKTKTPKGRALKRLKYTRRFVNVTLTGGKRKVSRLEHDRRRKMTGADDSDADEPQPRLINDSSQIDRNLRYREMLAFGHGSTQQWLASLSNGMM